MDILTLILVIQEYELSFHLFVSSIFFHTSLIVSGVQISLVKAIPKNFVVSF